MMYALDPVVDAERAIDRMEAEAEEAASYSRWHDEIVTAESSKLAANMLKALSEGDADTRVMTPGNFISTQPVAELLFYLADAHAPQIFELVKCAANGHSVQQLAIEIRQLVAKTYGDVYAENSLKSKGEL
jgi:hypothetical protein